VLIDEGGGDTRIRATGEGAERVRDYLTEKIPEAEIVGADHPAEFVMATCENFDEAVEEAAAAAAYAGTIDPRNTSACRSAQVRRARAQPRPRTRSTPAASAARRPVSRELEVATERV
jgi:hypothetical protein